jgi:hypothetical protein
MKTFHKNSNAVTEIIMTLLTSILSTHALYIVGNPSVIHEPSPVRLQCIPLKSSCSTKSCPALLQSDIHSAFFQNHVEDNCSISWTWSPLMNRKRVKGNEVATWNGTGENNRRNDSMRIGELEERLLKATENIKISSLYFDPTIEPISVLHITRTSPKLGGIYRCTRRCTSHPPNTVHEDSTATILLDIRKSDGRKSPNSASVESGSTSLPHHSMEPFLEFLSTVTPSGALPPSDRVLPVNPYGIESVDSVLSDDSPKAKNKPSSQVSLYVGLMLFCVVIITVCVVATLLSSGGPDTQSSSSCSSRRGCCRCCCQRFTRLEEEELERDAISQMFGGEINRRESVLPYSYPPPSYDQVMSSANSEESHRTHSAPYTRYQGTGQRSQHGSCEAASDREGVRDSAGVSHEAELSNTAQPSVAAIYSISQDRRLDGSNVGRRQISGRKYSFRNYHVAPWCSVSPSSFSVIPDGCTNGENRGSVDYESVLPVDGSSSDPRRFEANSEHEGLSPVNASEAASRLSMTTFSRGGAAQSFSQPRCGHQIISPPPNYFQVIKDWAARGILINRALLVSPPPSYCGMPSCRGEHHVHNGSDNRVHPSSVSSDQV